MSITVKVGEYDDLRGHVEYTIEVKDINGETWCFKRRYSALRFFHELLKKSEKRVPNFPPKKLFGNLNPDFLDARKKQIDLYFISLTKIPEIVHSSAFKDFIKPFDKAPIIKNKRAQKKIYTKEIADAVYQAASKIIDGASMEIISLAPYPATSQEIVQKNKEKYSGMVGLMSFSLISALPKAIPENIRKLKKEVQPRKWIEDAFNDCYALVTMSAFCQRIDISIRFP